VLERSQAGHWEADLISFKRNTQHILVLHERKTPYTATIKLENKTAEHTLEQIVQFPEQTAAKPAENHEF
jgi:IS30 family transposase